MLGDDLSRKNGCSVDSGFGIPVAEVCDESCGREIHIDQIRDRFVRA